MMINLLVDNLSANELLISSCSFHQDHIVGDLPSFNGLQKFSNVRIGLVLLLSIAILESAVLL
jgi:hypothetical protein